MLRALSESPERPAGPAEAQAQLPLNVWLVGQEASPTQRKGRYVPDSFVHPAKMLPAIARNVIETYTRPGDLVIDPMSGIGTTGVEALKLGRSYVGIEIERRYVELQRKNIRLAKGQAGTGQVGRVITGDARRSYGLENVQLVAFSPPYQDAIHPQYNEIGRIREKIRTGEASAELLRRYGAWDQSRERANAGMRPVGYSAKADNIGHFEGDQYWMAMRRVYERALEILQPGGYLAVITKDQRDRKTGELTNIYGDTVALCRSVGFLFHQHVVALLCRMDPETGELMPRTSHWQRMAVVKAPQKGRTVLLGQFEDVSIFMKPLAGQSARGRRRAAP